jgi:hypothetical protein
MTAPYPEARDGIEAALLCTYRKVSPNRQRAFIDAITRLADGQPAEDCYVEMLVEVGFSPALARETVRKAFRDPGDWREVLELIALARLALAAALIVASGWLTRLARRALPAP